MTICFGADNTTGHSFPVNELFLQVFVDTSLELSLEENFLFWQDFLNPGQLFYPCQMIALQTDPAQ